MKGFIAICAFLVVALAASEVFSQEQEQEYLHTEVAHGHRAKRSPYDPTLPLLLGKTFLLGHLLGPKVFHKGWGWGGHRHHHHGWGGWGWPSKVVHVSHGWGWH